MTKFIKIPLIVVSVLATYSLSFAKGSESGLFVEPGITYEMGNSELDWPTPFSNSTGDINGFGLMGRLGFHVSESFFAAIDARYKMVNFKNSANNYNADATGYDLAPVIGVQMPDIGLRVWGSYVLAGMLDPKASNSTDVKFDNAKGLRVGAGFHLYSFSINLEYQDLKYGKTTLEQIGPFASTADSDSINLTNKSYVLSLSFPLEI
jgi:hypothetical protein